MDTYDALIIADGLFPSKEEILSIIEKHPNIICCDGSVDTLIDRINKEPNWIIGDMDSISKQRKLQFKERLILRADQDHKDLEKALIFCLENGNKSVLVFGGTGKREDHAIGNIELVRLYNKKLKVDMISDYGLFQYCNSNIKINSFKGEKLSFFFNVGTTLISSENLVYPITNRIAKNFNEFTLNESLKEYVKIITPKQISFLLYRSF